MDVLWKRQGKGPLAELKQMIEGPDTDRASIERAAKIVNAADQVAVDAQKKLASG